MKRKRRWRRRNKGEGEGGRVWRGKELKIMRPIFEKKQKIHI